MNASPLRILHIGKYFPPEPGGIERYLADLMPASQHAGLAVAALVHQKPSPSSMSETHPYPVYQTHSLGELLHAPIAPGFLYAAHRAIQTFQPDILHLHLPNPSALALLTLPAARRLPWVIHWHADVGGATASRALRYLYPLYRPFERALLKHAQAVIATSKAYLEASRALQPWRDRTTMIPLGMATQRLRPPTKPQHDWPEGTTGLRLLAIGRLTYYKGFATLLQALAACPKARLLIVGEGQDRGSLERQIQDLDLSRRVRLLGRCPDDEVFALLAACDTLCLPSLDRSEAYGLVLLEAMYYGRPVIASDVPGSGIGWVVRTGQHGLLAPPGDVTALAQCIETMTHDPARRAEFGAAGRRHFAQHFDIQRTIPALLQVYHRITQR